MKLTLLCERCKVRGVETIVATFNYSELKWPIDLSIFKSPNPELLPDPFPAGMVDDWTWARCRICKARPFLNIVPQINGYMMIVTGERVPQGHEGNVLTSEHGYVPIPGYPGQKVEFFINESKYVNLIPKEGYHGVFSPKGEIVEQLTQDPPPIQNDQPEDGPVSCPACGQQYQSQANMDRYHKCKKE